MSSFQAIEDYTRRLRESQDNARRVALKGASKAFDHPGGGVSASAPVHIPARGAYAAAYAASGRTAAANTSQHADDRSLASSHASSAASHAFPKSFEKIPPSRPSSPLRPTRRNESPRKLHPSRRSSAQSLGVPPSDSGTARGKSPSNIAAVLAASRFVSRDAAPAAATRPKSWVIDSTLLHRQHSPLPDLEQDDEDDADAEDENEPPPELPPVGTVHGVRSWLETLEPHDEPVKKPQMVPIEPPAILNRRRRPKTMDLSPAALRRDDSNSKIDKELVSVASATKIKSPQPLRVSSVRTARTASSLESSILNKEPQGQEARGDKPVVPLKPEGVRRMSIPPPNPDDLPAAESPEEAAYRTPPLFPELSVVSPSTIGSLNRALSQKTKPELPAPRRSGTRQLEEPPKDVLRPTLDAAALSGSRLNLDIPRRKSGDTARTLSPLYPMPSVSPNALHGGLAAVAASQPSSPVNVPFQQRRISPHMTGDSLANAIVAGSLASSRAPSPAKTHHTGPQRRSLDRPRTPFDHFKRAHLDGSSRTPSPGKYTFRKMHSSDEENLPRAYKVSRNFLGMKQHPNKHHEGDRKRWRWEISAMERKRYEGVWAANKGLLLLEPYREPGSESTADDELRDGVCNVVVRDIWNRSRLPDHVLEEVWDLVDRSQIRRLDREEFVVGLWLIDQRLMGKKLPHKVSESVWNSARGTGVRIPSFSK